MGTLANPRIYSACSRNGFTQRLFTRILVCVHMSGSFFFYSICLLASKLRNVLRVALISGASAAAVCYTEALARVSVLGVSVGGRPRWLPPPPGADEGWPPWQLVGPPGPGDMLAGPGGEASA